MHQLQQLARQNPQWSLDELVEVANQLLPQYLPDQGSDSRLQETVNARLVRHYTTQGLLDRPLKLGREARYRYRHLLQLLLLRRLLTEGYSSSSLGQALQKSDRDLESLLQGGAQLTMESANPALAFLAKVRDRSLGQPPQQAMAPPAAPPVQDSPLPQEEASPSPGDWTDHLSTEGQRFGGSAIPHSAPSAPREVNFSPDVNAPEAFQGEISPPDEFPVSFDADFELSIDPSSAEDNYDLAEEVFANDALDSSLPESDALEEFDFDFEAFEDEVTPSAEASPDHLEGSAFSPAPDGSPRLSAPASPSDFFAPISAPSPSASVAPDVSFSLWSRHPILDGLELHIRADFIYPTTPHERATLLQAIAEHLRHLAANPPSHQPPSHRRPPP